MIDKIRDQLNQIDNCIDLIDLSFYGDEVLNAVLECKSKLIDILIKDKTDD